MMKTTEVIYRCLNYHYQILVNEKLKKNWSKILISKINSFKFSIGIWLDTRSAISSTGSSFAQSGYMVKAVGFPWKVKKRDVSMFFEGIDILNGEQGIRIVKRGKGAMEAYVKFATSADQYFALTRDRMKIDSQTIYG